MKDYALDPDWHHSGQQFCIGEISGPVPVHGRFPQAGNRHGHGVGHDLRADASAICAYLTDHYLLIPLGLEYLRTIAFILVIAVVVQFTEMVVHKTSPVLYQVLGIYLPLITTNCAVLAWRC
jgi:electron transport complex protein RnfA